MDSILVHGGHRLMGSIPISGAKNACLTLMPAALLTDVPLLSVDEVLERIDAVTVADVAALVAGLWPAGSLSTAAIGPQEEPLRAALAGLEASVAPA